jgi:hypothetical protein
VGELVGVLQCIPLLGTFSSAAAHKLPLASALFSCGKRLAPSARVSKADASWFYHTRKHTIVTCSLAHSKRDTQCMYNVTLTCVRVTIAVEKQYYVFVCVRTRARARARACVLPCLSRMQRVCAILWRHLWPVWLNIFRHYLINGAVFGKKVTGHKMCVLILSTIFA